MAKSPGVPIPINNHTNTSTDPFEDIWELNYISHNMQHFTLVRFKQSVGVEEAVRRARKYCDQNRLRFIRIRSAIITIEDPEGDIEE